MSSALAIPPAVRDVGLHVAGIAGVAAGGALTGYLAARNTRGAFIGALVHLGLFGIAAALLGTRFGGVTRAAYGALGLGAVAGVGYLLWRTRR